MLRDIDAKITYVMLEVDDNCALTITQDGDGKPVLLVEDNFSDIELCLVFNERLHVFKLQELIAAIREAYG